MKIMQIAGCRVGFLFFTACGLAIFLLGCGSREPFAYVPVSGKVTYEDGSLIPIDGLKVIFVSQTPPVDPKIHPRPGVATVDRATGTFTSATSHKANDGLVRGKHKVTLSPAGPMPSVASLLPAEYRDTNTTPLEVDTAQQPFELKVRKPKAGQGK
jgi:hypothetical protein